MAISLIPSSSLSSPVRRLEAENSLGGLLQNYVQAFRERIRLEETPSQWTQNVSTASSPSWVADALTPAFTQFTTAEEKRKKELEALDAFLDAAPRHMRKLARDLGDDGERAYTMVTGHLDTLVRDRDAHHANVEVVVQGLLKLADELRPVAQLAEASPSSGAEWETSTKSSHSSRRPRKSGEIAPPLTARAEVGTQSASTV